MSVQSINTTSFLDHSDPKDLKARLKLQHSDLNYIMKSILEQNSEKDQIEYINIFQERVTRWESSWPEFAKEILLVNNKLLDQFKSVISTPGESLESKNNKIKEMQQSISDLLYREIEKVRVLIASKTE